MGEMTARDDLADDLAAMRPHVLQQVALVIAEDRGDDTGLADLEAMSTDDLVTYIAGPQPAWQQRIEANR
jgi:hypothetical protein